jgi:hypothetical protein
MEQDSFAQVGSLQLVATKLVDLGDTQRKEILRSFDSETRCRIVEEMVNIKIQRGRKDDA